MFKRFLSSLIACLLLACFSTPLVQAGFFDDFTKGMTGGDASNIVRPNVPPAQPTAPYTPARPYPANGPPLLPQHSAWVGTLLEQNTITLQETTAIDIVAGLNGAYRLISHNRSATADGQYYSESTSSGTLTGNTLLMKIDRAGFSTIPPPGYDRWCMNGSYSLKVSPDGMTLSGNFDFPGCNKGMATFQRVYTPQSPEETLRFLDQVAHGVNPKHFERICGWILDPIIERLRGTDPNATVEPYPFGRLNKDIYDHYKTPDWNDSFWDLDQNFENILKKVREGGNQTIAIVHMRFSPELNKDDHVEIMVNYNGQVGIIEGQDNPPRPNKKGQMIQTPAFISDTDDIKLLYNPDGKTRVGFAILH